MLKKLLLILCFVLCAVSVAPADITSCGSTVLLGHLDDLTSDGTFWTYWKGLRVAAAASDSTAGCFKIRIVSDGGATDSQVGYALYEDNSGEVGTLMCSGYQDHYDWTTIGTGVHTFQLDTVHTTRNIVAGNQYWLLMICPQTEIMIERGPAGTEIRRGSPSTDYQNPPTSGITTVFETCTYSWAVTDASFSIGGCGVKQEINGCEILAETNAPDILVSQ